MYRYLAGEVVDPVEPPALRGGEEFVLGDDFGQLSLLLMLGERLGYEEAWQASDSWGGGAFIAFRRGDLDCVRIAISADTRADFDEISEAFSRWAAMMPDAQAREAGDLALLTSCDPGVGFEAPASPDSSRTLGVLAVRASFIAGLYADEFAHLDATSCTIDAIVAALGPDRFVRFWEADDPLMRDVEGVQRTVAGSMDRCGTGSAAPVTNEAASLARKTAREAIAHKDPAHALHVRAGRALIARLAELEQQLLRDGVGPEAAHRAAVVDHVEDPRLLRDRTHLHTHDAVRRTVAHARPVSRRGRGGPPRLSAPIAPGRLGGPRSRGARPPRPPRRRRGARSRR